MRSRQFFKATPEACPPSSACEGERFSRNKGRRRWNGEDTHMSITYLVHKTYDPLLYGNEGETADRPFFPVCILVGRKTDAAYRDPDLELIQIEQRRSVNVTNARRVADNGPLYQCSRYVAIDSRHRHVLNRKCNHVTSFARSIERDVNHLRFVANERRILKRRVFAAIAHEARDEAPANRFPGSPVCRMNELYKNFRQISSERLQIRRGIPIQDSTRI